MTSLSGLWLIDGIDLYDVFKLFIEEGSADFLKFAPKKSSIEHDWQDANGRDVDLSRIFFDQREGTLNMAIIATDKDDFFEKQQNFISQMIQPGLRRLTLASHGERSYYIYYKECSKYTAVKPLNGENEGLYAYRFSLQVVEPEPQVDASHVFLIDEEGHYIIT